MKLFYSQNSPFVRKVLVVAREKGLDQLIETVPAAVSPLARNAEVASHNPLGKIPCLILDDGRVLFDSPVITEYLDGLREPRLIPADPAGRLACQTLEALGDGMSEAGLLCRSERYVRPEEKRWPDWLAGQLAKIEGGMAALEASRMDLLNGPLTVGVISVGCALDWFSTRFADHPWRTQYPVLAAWATKFHTRPHMIATQHQEFKPL